MKHLPLYLLFFAVIAAWSTGCVDAEERYLPLVPKVSGVPAGGLSSARLVSVEPGRVELQLNVFAVDHFGTFISDLKPENFSFESDGTSGAKFEVLSVEPVENTFLGAYSVGMLFDQSGSINSTDPSDDRILAGTSFVNLLSGAEEAATAAFPQGSKYPPPYGLLANFTKDKILLVESIESLRNEADGGTPLYKSIFQLLSYVDDRASNENKAIIAFTDGNDTDGGISISSIVNLACEKNVSIYTVGLGAGVDLSALADIALLTGGSVMLAEDATQLVSLYSSLGALLRGQASSYNVRVAATTGLWRIGAEVEGVLALDLTTQYSLKYKFSKRLTRENAGPIDQRIPECSCVKGQGEDVIKFWKEKAEQFLQDQVSDVSIVNSKVTCAYVSIYRSNPDKFKWAGLAAIVSGKIGREIKARPYREFLSDSWAQAYFDKLEATTVDGNKAVYDDLAWLHLAYQEGGLAEIEKIYCYSLANGRTVVDLLKYRAWLKIDSGEPSLVSLGNRDLLEHEQRYILQARLYDPYSLFWDAYQTISGKVVSPVPGRELPMPNGTNVENVEQRWSWIEETIWPDWITYQATKSNIEQLEVEHRSYCVSCCP